MSNTKFYKELYRYLDREDVGKWGWVNLSDEKYKYIDLELSNGRRSGEDESYTSEEKEYYPLRLKLRLKRLLYSYVKASESYWKAHNYKNKIEPRLKKMEAVCDALVLAYKKAASGERSLAVDILYNKIFNDIELSDFKMVLKEMDYDFRTKTKKKKITQDDVLKEVCLYRMRPTEKYELFDEKGMSHIPFNLAHNTSNERYSICGLPSLYLASSAYGCWIEMNCPRIETVNIALFIPDEDIEFLDLCYPDENESYNDKYLILLPIIVACDMPVRYPNANYKYEYTIPQLILECLVKYRNENKPGKVLGIRYVSVKRKTMNLEYNYQHFKRLYYNYVFPPVAIEDAGQCRLIKEKFRYEKVTTCFNMQNIDLKLPLQFRYKDRYEQSIFFQLENHLKTSGMLTYDNLSGASAF